MKDCKTTILLCISDSSLRMLLRDLLHERGYEIFQADKSCDCIETACQRAPDLCVVESTHDMSGTDIVRELRLRNVSVPIVLLSDRTSKEDVLAGYAVGCDDYVFKPFSFDILACRIQALLRLVRRNMDDGQEIFSLGGVTFDAKRQLLGERELSSRESDMLLLLCRNLNKMVDKTVILKSVWLTDDCFAARSMAVYVHRLRQYIEEIDGVRIVAVHGKGLKLIDESAV